MSIGVAADFVTLTDHSQKQRAFRDRIFADDEEGRGDVPGLQDVEDLRSPALIGAVVKGQRDHARAITVASDRVRTRHPDEIDVGEEAVRAVGRLADAGGRERGDPENLTAAFDIDIGSLGDLRKP